MGNRVELHRIIKAPVERVFRAFSEPDALNYWMAPFGFVGKVHDMDFKVGGSFRMSFINFADNQGHTFGGKYIDIQPNKLIRHTDAFDDPNMPGELVCTITFRAFEGPINGTELRIVQENLPTVIPVEMCYLGWQESLLQLAQLVEHDNK